MRKKVTGLETSLQTTLEEKYLVEFKNKLLVEMVRAIALFHPTPASSLYVITCGSMVPPLARNLLQAARLPSILVHMGTV